MGYKEQLKQILSKFNALKNTVKKKIDDINQSDRYSQEYKAQLIQQAKDEAKAMQDQLTKDALKIIDDAKNKILGERTEVSKDQAYDLKLSNVLKILEMVGADMTVEELKDLVQPFEADYNTMKILRTIFAKGGMKGINEIFGYDTVDSRIRMLDELRDTISHAFFGDIDNADTLLVSVSLNYISEV